MEVTCQLRLDQLTKSSQAQIQFTCCWDWQRTKFGSGQKCLSKHWSAFNNPHHGLLDALILLANP
ncbi:MAG: hypothetical protein EOO61_18030 [Hymenobacter sp.]|nr:MAG: hypothetical protein EOO61_18030 [Hymenobacter sp.]